MVDILTISADTKDLEIMINKAIGDLQELYRIKGVNAEIKPYLHEGAVRLVVEFG